MKNGDDDAYRELVNLSSDRIFNIALSMLRNREDAEDVTQEVFAEIVHSVSGFSERSKLSTWIYRIAVSKSLEVLRSRNRNTLASPWIWKVLPSGTRNFRHTRLRANLCLRIWHNKSLISEGYVRFSVCRL